MLKPLCAAAALALLPVTASACASGAKCISVGDVELLNASFETDARADETGARWLSAPEPVAPTVPLAAVAPREPLIVSPLYGPGDILPRGKYSMLLNSSYFGLPPAPEGTLYFEVDMKVLLVDRDSYEILADVSRETAATF